MKILVIGSGEVGNALFNGLITLGTTRDVAHQSSRALMGQSDEIVRSLVAGTEIILWCARDSGIPGDSRNSIELWERLQQVIIEINWTGKFVFTSSAGAIYGNETEFPSSEGSRKVPVDTYGRLKKRHEEGLIANSEIGSFTYLIARITNIFTFDKGDKGILGSIIRSIQDQETFVLQWGQQSRDFIHLDDVVRILLELISQDYSGVFNLGSGLSITIFDLIEKMETFYRNKCTYQLETAIPAIPRSEVAISKLLKTGIKRARTIDECLQEKL